MKNSIIFFIFLSYSCNSDRIRSIPSKKSDTIEHQHNIKKEIPRFEDFEVEHVSVKIDKQTIDKIYDLNKTHFDQLYYRRMGLEEYCKIFAGKYIAIDISQGSETFMTYIFDYQTGEMYESPLFMFSAEYRKNSRLFIKDPYLSEKQHDECKDGILDCERKYYAWDENKKVFDEIK